MRGGSRLFPLDLLRTLDLWARAASGDDDLGALFIAIHAFLLLRMLPRSTYHPQSDTDRRACGEVHKAAVTRDHILLAS